MHILFLLVTIGEPVYTMDPAELDAYVRELNQPGSTFEERIHRVVKTGVGTPYQDGPLGEGSGGEYDTDPLVDFGRADCVTFVEQSIAAAVSPSYDELLSNLQQIRYKNGQIGYESRNHFMIADWVRNNPFVEDITAELGVPLETSTRTISRRGFFERVDAPGLGAGTPDESITLAYVPAHAAGLAEAELPDTAMIIFIGKVDWLFALHCGMFIRGDDGVGRLYHASSKAGEVAGMDLSEYVASQSTRYIGFTAYRLNEPRFGAVK